MREHGHHHDHEHGGAGAPTDVGAGGPLGGVALVDHHCHGVVPGGLGRAEFELWITESGDPAPPGSSFFDSQLGLSLRRWCPPVLGLPPHASPQQYVDRRQQLGAAEASRRLLRAAGVTDFLLDTGYRPGQLTSPAEFAVAARARAHQVVRLERVAEDLAAEGAGAAEFAGRYREALAGAAAQAVAVKSIAAYRHGLHLDPRRPGRAEVTRAAAYWLRAAASGRPRVRSPVLLRFLLWCAIDVGLPVQIHTGFGDRDLVLHCSSPSLLRGFIGAAQPAGVPLLLLHCYPYHREAGYLAQVYPHVYCDVGLALNFAGARAHAVLAEILELAPFGKVLYSSDASGVAELHYLGAAVFRHALARVTAEWVADGFATATDARRIAGMIGAANARRVYGLAGGSQ